MVDNKNEEGESNQKTELKPNTGKEILLVAHMALKFLYACISHILYIVDSEFNYTSYIYIYKYIYA